MTSSMLSVEGRRCLGAYGTSTYALNSVVIIGLCVYRYTVPAVLGRRHIFVCSALDVFRSFPRGR